MRTPTVCNCNPAAHRVSTTDAALLRRVRRDCLADAKRWQNDPEMSSAATCSLYTAHLCLVRLRELKAATLKRYTVPVIVSPPNYLIHLGLDSVHRETRVIYGTSKADAMKKAGIE